MMTKFSTFRPYTSVRGTAKAMHLCIAVLFWTALILNDLAAQVEKATPNTDFHKWEVSVDLKPLLRVDAPYSVLFKRYLTPKKAVRLGLGTSNVSKDKLLDKEVIEFLGRSFDVASPLIYSQDLYNGSNDVNEISASLGYTYFIKKEKVSVYTNTDFMYYKVNNEYDYSGRVSRVWSGKDSLFIGFDPSFILTEKSTTYSLRQMFGLTYSFNKNISIGTEMSVSLSYRDYFLFKIDRPLPNEIHEKFFGTLSKTYKVGFVPLLGFYLNYHFNFKNSST